MTTHIQWVSTHGQVEHEVVQYIEKSIGVIFPEDYKSIARVNHGGSPIPDTFNLEEYGEGVINRLLSFNQDSPLYIIKVWESLKTLHRQPKEIVPFANDPFGNLYVFDYREGDNPTLAVYDHEEGDDPLSPLCNNFTEWISNLSDEEEEI